MSYNFSHKKEISQKLKEYFSTNKIFFTNLLIIEVVSHIFYKVSFENFLLRDFEINKKVYSESLDFYRTELESPFNTILVNLFQIKDPDVYTLVIYIIFQITLVFICKNLSFLGEYSTLFLFGGWLVTISWWIGFVENISTELHLIDIHVLSSLSESFPNVVAETMLNKIPNISLGKSL